VRNCCWQRGEADVKPPAVSHLKQCVIHMTKNNARRTRSDRQIRVVYAVCNGVHRQPEQRVRRQMGHTIRTSVLRALRRPLLEALRDLQQQLSVAVPASWKE
jgi:hypothetical protein